MLNKFIIVLRILFFGFFLLSSFSKMYPNAEIAIQLFEKEQLLPLGIPYCPTTWISRMLIALELLVAIFFVVPFYFKRITLPIATGLLLFFTVFLSYEVFILGKTTGNCGCFGQLIPMTPTVSLMKNIIALILLVFLFWKRNSIVEQRNPSIFYYCSAYIIILGVIFGIAPNSCSRLDNTQRKELKAQISPEVQVLKNQFPDLVNNVNVLCFFSATCSHCKETAKSLHRISAKTFIKKYYVVFLKERKIDLKIKKFLLDTKLSANYTTMELVDFPGNTYRFPAVLLVDEGKVRSSFYGNDTNKFEEPAFLKAINAMNKNRNNFK